MMKAISYGTFYFMVESEKTKMEIVFLFLFLYNINVIEDNLKLFVLKDELQNIP